MEAAAAAASSSILLSFSSPRRSTAATFLRLSTASPRITCSATQQLPLAAPWLLTAEKSSTRRRRSILSLRCSSAAAGSPSAVASSERWILEPAGDGDWKHIGYRVARPGAIEIASEAMTVGRVPENAAPSRQFLGCTLGWRRRTGTWWSQTWTAPTAPTSTRGSWCRDSRLPSNPGASSSLVTSTWQCFG
ncbi:hypothetical protein CFC21_061194 [Triticum aestivum]|uniref:Uncharacterized protein n=2 Tax=Triticum aestivum TaxID=4565 RepID=A0A3B6JI43_WHEAT|nr:uncharacterized protein LOC123096532 [Triticum aestivum]KAF7053220.1 hypothetical protein CFC21_061194 [Triticum aestivum]